MWYQQTLTLGPKSRGFHLVTDEILGPDPRAVRGEGWPAAPPAPAYFRFPDRSTKTAIPPSAMTWSQYFLNAVPDNAPYEHDYEGPDDMPSHIKSSMLGVSLMLPVEDGRVRLGTWQGIWLGGASDTRRFAAHRCDAHGGIKDDNFGVITVLHGETGSRAERPQRLESHAD
ncbi:thiamin phosphate synthase [Klebsiella pneumoniae]|nr:thiamin phosphate synthase [Klebsiella pneumoniae]